MHVGGQTNPMFRTCTFNVSHFLVNIVTPAFTDGMGCLMITWSVSAAAFHLSYTCSI